MTVAETPRRRALSGRPDTARLIDQLTGIDAWHRTRREVESQAAAAASRELRLDGSRRLDVVRRQHRALVEATERQLRDSGDTLRSVPAPRAVVVHRNDWFKDKLATALRAGGVELVGDLSNGADAVGLVVAEQPDVLLVEERLPMLGALDVLHEVRRLAPRTLVAVQVVDDRDIGPFLEAGARTAFPRRTPPADVALALCELLVA